MLTCVLFVLRLSSLFQVAKISRSAEEVCFRLYRSLFFGAVAKIDAILNVVESAPQLGAVRDDAFFLKRRITRHAQVLLDEGD